MSCRSLEWFARPLGFITPWVSYGTLWSCLQSEDKRRHLNVWDIAFQLCDALHYVHSHGVVHFDLKSNNVLLDRVIDGSVVVKLFDFGLSREVESTLRTALDVGGTPNWQAPETWGDLTSTHPSADVYSFGCVLIELFGQKKQPGCFPWMAKNFSRSDKAGRKAIKNQVQAQVKPPELSHVDDSNVHDLIIDCLSFDPTLRPTMKKVRARLLAAFMAWAVFFPFLVSFTKLFFRIATPTQAESSQPWTVVE